MMKIFYLFLLLTLLFACNSSREDTMKMDELNEKGIQLMDKQDYEGALIHLRNAKKYTKAENTSKSNLYRNMAIAFEFLDNIDSNRYYLERGIEVADKNSFYYYLNSAELALLDNDIPKGLEFLKKAEPLTTSKMEINNDYALIYFGDYDEKYIDDQKAYDYSKKAYEESQQVALKDMLAACALNLEKYTESIKLYQELSTEFPSNMYFKFQLGCAKYLGGYEDEGEQLMAYAAARDNDCKEFYEQFFGE